MTHAMLTSKLPDEVGNLRQLEKLHISRNSFTGMIPNSISNCSMLKEFDIASNHFSGFIPNSKHGNRGGAVDNELSIIDSLTKCQHLEVIQMSINPLNGFLPKSIGNFSSLQQFLINNCEINGVIPDEIGNLSHLQTVSLADNRLTGSVPSTINGLRRLQRIFLSYNKINGSIPIAICDLPVLGLITLESNNIMGEIPSCIGSITSLRSIGLSDNLLESSIPSSLWNLKYLLDLFLDQNRLNGTLSNEIGNLKALVDLDLSGNRFSGKLPTSLDNLVSLQQLSLSNNSLEGSIPESFGKMINLKYLDLSNNNLEGSIPYSLTSLQDLEYFNVSNNKLIGEIPSKGPFVTFNASSFALNEALCGSSQYHVPPCVEKSMKRSKKRKVPWWVWVILGTSSILVVLVLTTLVWKHKKKSKQLSEVRVNSLPTRMRISYYELLQATGKFSETNLLGRGSFGSVYKGILTDGTVVAIKVFNLQAVGALQSFDVECEVLRNLRHRNLTKVITSCSNSDDFKALVLEYISNGSLEKCLHLGSCFLDILQRLSVMVDVAHALEYLHYGFSSPIVHCDIKPSNVLLDDNMMARLSDFGLTRFLNKEESFTYTSTLATLGYIAPEYGLEGLVSRAGDVYSFGILMIETFTKRKPSDEMFDGDLSMKGWAHQYFLEDQLIQMIDSDLLSRDEQRLNQEVEILNSIVELALNCCVDLPKERMNMKDVCVALEKIKHRYETFCIKGET
ncbi:hypothetical protein LIER_39514 [Lithospermum erythrorhizon]|uniref:non-specific serine/threonine protein kinase n=1 Tax=Lithospermum erythrorhizon TaxID=34254 RepID=A0AAV3QIS5_LITER